MHSRFVVFVDCLPNTDAVRDGFRITKKLVRGVAGLFLGKKA